MNKFKAYFKGNASKKAYQITFYLSMILLIIVGMGLILFRTAIYSAYSLYESAIFIFAVVAILGFTALRSQSVYYDKRREEQLIKTVKGMLTNKWQNVTFDYYNTELPDIVKDLCYDFEIEAKIENEIIFIRCNACNGRYVEEMQTTDYNWFAKYFEIET